MILHRFSNENMHDKELTITSLKDARAVVDVGFEQLKDVTVMRKFARNVASYVIDHYVDMTGDAEEWHNFINVFLGVDAMTGMKLVEVARYKFNADASLLADGLNCASSLGDWKKGDQLLRLATDQSYRAVEDWSLAVYVADYYKEKARSVANLNERDKLYYEGISFVGDAESRLPENDRIYNAGVELLLESGRRDKAQQLLDAVIGNAVGDRKHAGMSMVPVPLPQCCLTYLNDFLANSCDYQRIIEVADYGLRFSTTKDESVKTGYFAYRKALAMEALCHCREGGLSDKGYIRRTMSTYALAYALDDEDQYRGTCVQRFKILAAMGDVRDLYIDEFLDESAKNRTTDDGRTLDNRESGKGTDD